MNRHMTVENSHASSAYLRTARQSINRAATDVIVRSVMAHRGRHGWPELLGAATRPVIVVLNDNGRLTTPPLALRHT